MSMYMDAITLAAVADEWRSLLSGARVDTIIQPTEYSIAVQCYTSGTQGPGGQSGKNRWLYLSAHPQLARSHLTTFKPAKIASEPPAFVMLLRKYLEGARVEAITQPRWERVLEIVVSHRASPESEERVRSRLIVEIMGRMSNIILCDEHGLILGSLKHVGADINRYRVIAANVQYVPPPPQQRTFAGQSLPRLEPTTVSAAQLRAIAVEEPAEPAAPPAKKARSRVPEQPKLWQLLTRNLLGFSPLLAREAVYRTTGEAESLLELGESAWEELAWNVRELAGLYDTRAWQPQLVERIATDGRAEVAGGPSPTGGRPQGIAPTMDEVVPPPRGRVAGGPSPTGGRPQGIAPTMDEPIAFAPYVLEQYAALPGVRVRMSSSINGLIDEYYAGSEWRDAMESVRAPLRKILQTQRERCRRKAEVLQQELAASEEANRYRLSGELLLAYQHEVKQGQASVTVQNFFGGEDEEGSPEVTIPLDPRFDAVGNANRLFNKYHKLRRGLALVPGQIEQNASELATIEQLLADLMLAENAAEVALVKAEVQTAGYIRGKKAERVAQAGAHGRKQSAKGKGGKQAKGKPVAPGGGVPLHIQSRDGFTILVGKNSRQNEEVTFRQAAPSDVWLHARGVPGAHVIVKAAGRDVPRGTIEQAASLAAYYSQARGSTSAPVDYTLQRHVRHMKGGGPGMVIYEREKTIYAEPLSFAR